MSRAKLPPVFRVVLQPIEAFFALEAASGILLALSAVTALIWANSPYAGAYVALFDTPFHLEIGSFDARFTLDVLVNDGLMTVFFFVVGMEIKRELAVGELNTVRKAMMPAIAAAGGMLIPAGLYLAFNPSGPSAIGWGIPMATDIAFSIGCLTLIKSRVPHAMLVFLTALAIFDDLGGILVIALFYGSGISLIWLGISAAIAVVLFSFNRMHILAAVPYAMGGALLWYTIHHAGIHATISGVIVGLCVPARSRRRPREIIQELNAYTKTLLARAPVENVEAEELLRIEEQIEDMEAPLNRFVHALHPYVAFLIVPLFALANSGVSVMGMGPEQYLSRTSLGIAVGLFFGKQAGIFAFTWVAIRLNLSSMPGGASYRHLFGVATIGGIGFTVALFIANLAFASSPALLDEAKVGILLGSFASALIGMLFLRYATPPNGQSVAPTRAA